MNKEKVFADAAEAIIEGDESRALDIIKKAETEGLDLVELLSKGFSAGMQELGEKFSSGEVFLPELIYISGIMKNISAEVESKLDQSSIQKKGVMIIATVAGDVHDIGKGIVASLVKTNGVEVHDLGREVPAEEFVKAVKEFDADFVGSSALLTTTMTEQQRIEELLKEAGLRDKVKTFVGGAPITQRWADKIGADYYSEDATETIRQINEIISAKTR
ncbi:cobalamin B12-binding domain-containing protein [Sinanaerobacter chloroacetimidivorans]|uniref:Corrinoid protein n=1 Tax=Sinanaerobacter chloroacetimidivorans TaxID=2818044 RepID=A0A8J7VYD2_9FIRM|nr:corrinoid protein [Sinanaerobacter chloroacetimidivorans]MBR0597357.1 corrinoid protein [Sinanaerobacter chloroacetimidivorans]